MASRMIDVKPKKQLTDQEVLKLLNQLAKYLYFHPEKIGPHSFYKSALGMHFFFVEEWFRNEMTK